MKKFACVLTALTLFGAATPAKAQYFFADSGSIDVGADAYAASSWWGGPGYAYSSPGLVYSSPGYASSSCGVVPDMAMSPTADGAVPDIAIPAGGWPRWRLCLRTWL